MAWAETSRGISAVPNSDIWNLKAKSGPMVVASICLHVFVIGGVLLYAYVANGAGSNWGTNSAGEGTISVNITSSIPLPTKPVNDQNVLANESEGLSQSQQKQPPQEDKDAIAIADHHKPPKVKPTAQQLAELYKPRVVQTPKSNVVPYGQGGPTNLNMAVVKTALGNGGLKVGQGDFGSRYAWYVDAVRRKISENWFKYEVDPSLSSANRVYLVFNIERDGSPSDVRIETSSGVPSLDQSAMRSLQRIDTFGPLPPDYGGSKVSVEFFFDYKK